MFSLRIKGFFLCCPLGAAGSWGIGLGGSAASGCPVVSPASAAGGFHSAYGGSYCGGFTGSGGIVISFWLF
ncbi:hypothetical protein [Phocaeicola coprophilus]|uniref:hypothetical protein n=1 Tax=Phocaeicola coprophilus TaxID=387090 RepID=UPI003AB516BF